MYESYVLERYWLKKVSSAERGRGSKSSLSGRRRGGGNGRRYGGFRTLYAPEECVEGLFSEVRWP
jgi:hypothetical protein